MSAAHTLSDLDAEERKAHCWGCNRRVRVHRKGNSWVCADANIRRVRHAEYLKALDAPAGITPEWTIPDETLAWENWKGSPKSWLKMLEKTGQIDPAIGDEYSGFRGLPGEVVPTSSLYVDDDEPGVHEDEDMTFSYVLP